jgi:hypothetical protein
MTIEQIAGSLSILGLVFDILGVYKLANDTQALVERLIGEPPEEQVARTSWSGGTGSTNTPISPAERNELKIRRGDARGFFNTWYTLLFTGFVLQAFGTFISILCASSK